MRRGMKIVALAAACLMAFSFESAFADPPGGHGRGKGKHKDKGGRGGPPPHAAVWRGGGPPPWAPAHGYRAKHGGYQTSYVAPYGISGGSCDRKELGMVIGGITGAVIGSQIASKKDRELGILGGTIIGAIVGGSIGSKMDNGDHNCVGQTLEHAPDNQSISWQNPDVGTRYQVTPTRTYEESGRYCREYQTVSLVDGRQQQTYGTACRDDGGDWRLMN